MSRQLMESIFPSRTVSFSSSEQLPLEPDTQDSPSCFPPVTEPELPSALFESESFPVFNTVDFSFSSSQSLPSSSESSVTHLYDLLFCNTDIFIFFESAPSFAKFEPLLLPFHLQTSKPPSLTRQPQQCIAQTPPCILSHACAPHHHGHPLTVLRLLLQKIFPNLLQLPLRLLRVPFLQYLLHVHSTFGRLYLCKHRIVRLLLPSLGGRTTQKRSKPSLATGERQEQMDGGEHISASRRDGDYRFVTVKVLDASNKALALCGDSGYLKNAILNGIGVKTRRWEL